MFVTEKIPALFKGGKLKLEKSDEGGTRRVAEATLVIEPFPADLAHEIGEDIAGHLFDEANVVRDELESIDLRVRCGLQSITVQAHEYLPTLAILSPVSLRDVTAKRIESKDTGRSWLSQSFVLVFSLEEKAARNFVLDEFGKTLLWTFVGMQRELLSEASLHESIAKIADPNGKGDITVSVGVNGGDMTEIDPKAHREKAKQLRAQADRQTQ